MSRAMGKSQNETGALVEPEPVTARKTIYTRSFIPADHACSVEMSNPMAMPTRPCVAACDMFAENDGFGVVLLTELPLATLTNVRRFVSKQTLKPSAFSLPRPSSEI